MIGNDIVDLAYSRQTSNWQRPRFLDKVFTASEQAQIAAAPDPEQWVWLLWSIKESAYKLILRAAQGPFFAPKQITCEVIPPMAGNALIKSVVHYQGQVYCGESQLSASSIHSLVYARAERPTFSSARFCLAQSDYPHQGAFIREQLLRHYADTRQIDLQKLAIQKNLHGIPSITMEGVPQTTALSISHHGHFAAYAFCE